MLQPKSFHFPWRITLKKGVDWGPFHPTRIRFLPQKTSASKKMGHPKPQTKKYFWICLVFLVGTAYDKSWDPDNFRPIWFCIIPQTYRFFVWWIRKRVHQAATFCAGFCTLIRLTPGSWPIYIDYTTINSFLDWQHLAVPTWISPLISTDAVFANKNAPFQGELLQPDTAPPSFGTLQRRQQLAALKSLDPKSMELDGHVPQPEDTWYQLMLNYP